MHAGSQTDRGVFSGVFVQTSGGSAPRASKGLREEPLPMQPLQRPPEHEHRRVAEMHPARPLANPTMLTLATDSFGKRDRVVAN